MEAKRYERLEGSLDLDLALCQVSFQINLACAFYILMFYATCTIVAQPLNPAILIRRFQSKVSVL
jgi:hypothetical protein